MLTVFPAGVGGSVGGGVEDILLTLAFCVPRPALPAVSCAMAVITCAPLAYFVVSHCIEYGGVERGEPKLTPSIWYCSVADAGCGMSVEVRLTVPIAGSPTFATMIEKAP